MSFTPPHIPFTFCPVIGRTCTGVVSFREVGIPRLERGMARLGPEECMFDRSGPARKLTAHHGKGAPSPKLVLLSLIVILLTAFGSFE